MNAIRTATAEDIPAIVEVTNAAYAAEVFCIEGLRTNEADIEAKMQAGDFLVIDSAGGAGKLAGSVYAALVKGRGYLGLLAVDPDCQGQGLSKLLTLAVEEWCRARQCRYLDLTVINVRHELFPFYKKLGFAPRDSVPFPRPEVMKVALHLVTMTKPLYPAENL
ncbi:MAG: GNAT family N-acetyltransferase [Betaproteobacteria bacterium]|nr:GNAT family N-acetyltransferase [Betaproteobacteria bacterium]